MTKPATTKDAPTTGPTPSEVRAYSRGYAAGKRRKNREVSDEVRCRREDAMWLRFMGDALAACIRTDGWKRGDQPISDVPSRTMLAADFADEAVKLARLRGRL